MEITIALTKGRILEETISILAKAGIIPAEDISLSRKLLFNTNTYYIILYPLVSRDL